MQTDIYSRATLEGMQERELKSEVCLTSSGAGAVNKADVFQCEGVGGIT